MTKKTNQRIFDRFEIAISNFGRSCISLNSNERTFQGWFTSMVIQEFGISHVYRDVDIVIDKLLKRSEVERFSNLDSFTEKNQVIPDLLVSWEAAVDTRNETLRDTIPHSNFLNQFAIISELKVTGSTTKPTSKTSIRKDIIKLGLLGLARKKESFRRAKNRKRNLGKEYMVILDNCKNALGEFEPKYSPEYFETFIIQNLQADWHKDVPIPDVFLILPKGNDVRIVIFRAFKITMS